MGLFSRLSTILVLVVVFFIILTHRLSLMSQDSSTLSRFKDGLVKLKTIIQTNLPDISDFHVFGVENSQDDDDQVVVDTALFNTSSTSNTPESSISSSFSVDLSAGKPKQPLKLDPFKILESVNEARAVADKTVTNTATNTGEVTDKTKSAVPLKAKGFNPKELLNAKKEPDVPQLDHPLYSPRPGSDISEANQMNLLQCPNQSSCIVPELQLKIKTRVYFCKHPIRGGVRFYFLAREGFLLHPNVEMVEESEMNSADYIIYLPASAPWQKSECNASIHTSKKMIVLDEFDGVTPLYSPLPTFKEMVATYGPSLIWYFLYFKRSYVGRRNGEFIKYAHAHKHDIYPLTYPLAEAYIQLKFNQVREIDIMCTLRGSKEMSTRLRAQEWVTEYVQARGITNAITGQLNTATRTSINKEYFEHMHNSRIIVTVNPAHWEGDFRLWESMATGALIFVDPLFVPHPFPLEDGKHVVYYSNNNKTDLWAKLDYYRNNPEIARKVAINGYLHTMTHHRTVSFADYVLRSAHLKRATYKGVRIPDYKYSAQYLRYEARVQEENILKTQWPGAYNQRPMFNHTHLYEY